MRRVLRRPWIALVVALVAICMLFVFGRPDFVAADPLWYAGIAHSISVDPWSVLAPQEIHPFVMRIGLTVPLALAYRAFGVSGIVTNLPSLIAAIGVLLTVYAAATTPRAKLIGLAMCTASVPLFHQMVLLGVDLPSAALMGCSVLYLTRRDRLRGWLWLVAAVAAWGAAFLVKETALWCAPIWIYAIVVDIRAAGWRRTVRVFAPAIATGLVLGAGYLVLCARVWGDPLARLHGITQAVANVRNSPYVDSWAMAGSPASEWLARLTWQVPWLLIQMFGATLVPVVLAPWLVRQRDRIWIVAVATIVGLYWFGSSTTREYIPLPISQRMIIPALPFILVTAAIAADRAIERWRLAEGRRRAIIVVFAATVVGVAVRPIGIALAHAHPETDAFATIQRELATAPEQHFVLVCGEPRCLEIAQWYFGFEPQPNIAFVHANDFSASTLPSNVHVQALVNRIRAQGAHRTDPKSDRTADITALGLPVLAGNKNVSLYDAGDGVALQRALH
jgi:hypothetical protein